MMNVTGIQRLRDQDYKDMEDQLSTIFYEIVFKEPVESIREMDPKTARVIQVENANPTDLERALRTGRIQYVGGVFSGEFNAQISVEIRRMGGRFDKRMKVYFIDQAFVPAWVKTTAQTFRSKSKTLHDNILKFLDQREFDLGEVVEKHRVDAMKTIERVQDGFRVAADAIGVSPKITPESKARLAKEYSENMSIYIEDFSRSAIKTLRAVVEDNAMKGYRFDRLIETIRLRYGVTRSKAAFLARQETALFMSKYREMRFAEGGVDSYVWDTAGDEKVRHSHAILDGKRFFYKSPPVVDQATGRRANPGQDFNCRCVDKPVINRMAAAA